MPTLDPWPLDLALAEAAADFLRQAALSPRVVIACHGDADGLSAAELLRRALATLGARAVEVVPARRGEHAHTPSFRERLVRLSPARLVVTDMGMRAGVILPGVPTLVIDHHRPLATPDGALVVNGHDREPVHPSSLLAWLIAQRLVDADDVAWLALLGVVGDLGEVTAFPALAPHLRRAGRTAVADAVALINAARRAPEDDVACARDVLAAAGAPADISKDRVAGVDRLRGYRAAVASELARCSRVAPVVVGDVALIAFRSGAQVHPLVAMRWRGRLKGRIVLVANGGFMRGRVNFVVRTTVDVDLLDWLAGHAPADAGDEYAQGHRQATGGSLLPSQFLAFVESLGFDPAAVARALGLN